MRRKPVSQRVSVQRARSARRAEPQRPIARIRSATGGSANSSRAPKQPNRLSRAIAAIDWGKVRLISVGVLFAILGGLLWLRAAYIQVLDGPRLAEMARRQHMRTEMIVGKRGDIVDRNGLVLASSLESRSVFVRPAEVRDVDETARILSGILRQQQNSLRKLLAEKKNFIWIARKVDDRTAAAVAEARLHGIYLTPEYERIYPYREMAGQLLGFVGIDGQGLEGIEQAYDAQLRGESMTINVQRDGSGRRFYPQASLLGNLDGGTVRLSIDMQIQHIAEQGIAESVQKYNAKWGGCVIVDVPTGEVLAWAQYPYFNPNKYSDYKPAQWRNRLAMDALEPGSTLKPLIVAAALEEGTTSLEKIYNCEKGRWKFQGTTLRDVSPRADLTLAEVVRYSSNIGMGKVGLELGARRSWAYLTRLGFGSRTGLPIGESKGILHDPAQWSELDVASTAFGQSLSVTAAQMMKAYLALASYGEARQLRLVLSDNPPASTEQQVFSVETSRKVLGIMREVVQGDGSGRRARITGIEVGGKTGTAQKADDTGKYGEGRLASFVGIMPIEAPRFLVFTLVDEPQTDVYGGVVAAPAFQQIGSKLLAYQGLLPDPDAPQLAAAQVAAPVIAGTSVAPNPASAPAVPVAQNVPASRSIQVAAASDIALANGQVPNVLGQSVRQAVEILAKAGVVPQIKGAGPVVIQQEPTPGSSWKEEGGTCVLWLSENI